MVILLVPLYVSKLRDRNIIIGINYRQNIFISKGLMYRKVCINARTFNSNRPLLVTAPVVLFLEYISNRTPNSSLSNIFSRFLMVSYMVILLVPLYVSKVIEVEILY